MTPEQIHHIGRAWSRLVERQMDLQEQLARLAKDDMLASDALAVDGLVTAHMIL